MTRTRRLGDSGQAFPLYITVVGGLLFLAFAYLAVGQAAANRNGAQTAADAAALAAAQDRRDQLAGRWTEDILDPSTWQAVFDGDVDVSAPSCRRAEELAARNDAHVLTCAPKGLLGFTVEVETDRTVGESIVPGTEDMRSRESATAVIKSRCDVELPAEDAAGDVLPELTCDGDLWTLDPEDLTDLPGPEDLFDVHLAE
ncbi:pilus assembly protein TadG-related protein [Streptomyces sp. NRRL F-5065]|uniref:pilus assembly protein TadG-related protein n=1 Tax=Streptomyces sp. NRRL F-5065 TaxID=1463855 RepID=UPI0004BF087D|nr:pilus assembly protein TadG-related protein [Streptomyces sp. NRRL F-5065]